MPWQERSLMTERQEFVWVARQEDANIAEVCRRFGISRKTGYKWLGRAAAGDVVLADRPRRPHTSPTRTSAALEARVLALRHAHPAWGGRKLHQHLGPHAPAPSTITAILRRHGLLTPEPPPRDYVRFERATANELWQMDFMGHRALATGRVHPFSLLDDHSRFALTLMACPHERQAEVQAHLTTVFQQYGLPQEILADHGAPWGTGGQGGITTLAAWLVQLGITVGHGRPYHPQTRGKVERFHRTIAAEVFTPGLFPDLPAAQVAFDRFRACYNQERPHEALAGRVPADRYQSSPRPFPETLPPITYDAGEVVRVVTAHGSITWRHRRVFISRGLVGQPVAVRPTQEDGRWTVYFCHQQVATIGLRDPEAV